MLLNDIKDDYYDTFRNIKFETLKNWKQKRIAIISIISFMIPALFYAIPKLSGNEVSESIEIFISNIMGFSSLIIVLCAIFFGADAINSERYHKTALITFPLPQRRTSIFVGKYIAQLFTSWIMIGLYYATTAIFAGLEFGFDEVPIDNFLKSIYFSYIYATALLSGAFFLSSVVRSPSISMMFTFFLVFMLFPIASLLLGIVDVDTSYIITNYSSFITEVFRFPSSGFGPPRFGGDELSIDKGVNLAISYSIVFTTLSWYLNNKKEV